MTIKEQLLIDNAINQALLEDIGDGDHTSNACIPIDQEGKAHLKIKDNGILAGMAVAQRIFELIDSKIKFIPYIADATPIKIGEIAFEVHGNTRNILLAERLVLNVMQRMSGIATYTHQLCQLVEGFSTTLLDTRKTTPNFRLFEKMAVKIGGGQNHRFGLYDMVMIKDNHIDFAGGIVPAIQRVHDYLAQQSKNLYIIIEARTIADVQAIVQYGGVNRIMLDNFSPALIKEALPWIPEQFATEASGGITEKTLKEYAATGVDYISIGALTRDATTLDLSLKAF